MLGKKKQEFENQLDIVQLISKPARENLGEDSFFCAKKSNSAIVSVFDGCGGLGSRKYDTFRGHTGAYIASRMISGAVRDWYHHNSKNWRSAQSLALDLDKYIKKAYAMCGAYEVERLKIRGSMVRRFPTTLALAYAEYNGNGIVVHVLWAGDSRVYLLDSRGLAQLTKDDTDVEDALENLMSDGAMTNVLSLDGNYNLNYKTIKLTEPAIVFAATDGCFGYIPSPMEFEYIILKSLTDSCSPEAFKKSLYEQLIQYAGDDLALGLMSFNFGSFAYTKQIFVKRSEYMEKKYIRVLEKEDSDECTQRLWNEYKSVYERYLTLGKKERFDE